MAVFDLKNKGGKGERSIYIRFVTVVSRCRGIGVCHDQPTSASPGREVGSHLRRRVAVLDL